MEQVILYECDPEKNKFCRKTLCWWKKTGDNRCALTSVKKYAKLDKYGNPIIRHMDNLRGEGEYE
jgi:hypothetical protein